MGQKNADTFFKITAAHEFGHSVLSSFHGKKYSWEHHNTSKFWGTLNQDTPGFPNVREPIDLMKYYDRKKHNLKLADEAQYTLASEVDVKTLIWVTQVVFNIIPDKPDAD